MEGSGKTIPAPAPDFPEIDSILAKGKQHITTSSAAPAAAFASSSLDFEQELSKEKVASRKRVVSAFAPPPASIPKLYEAEEEEAVAPSSAADDNDDYAYQAPVRALQQQQEHQVPEQRREEEIMADPAAPTSNMFMADPAAPTSNMFMADPVASTSTASMASETVEGYLAKIKLPVAAKEPVTTFTDLVKWKNPYLTGLVFATLNIIFILVLFKGYSLLRVFASAAVFYLLIGFVVVNISKLLKGFLDRDLIPPPKLPQEYIRKDVVLARVDTMIEFGNHFVNACVKALYCVESKQTLQLAGIAYALSVVGMIIPDMVLIYLTVLVVFTFPIVYEKYQKEIDDAWIKIKKLLEQYYQMGKEEATKRSAEFQKVAAKKVEDLKTQVQERSTPYLEKTGLAEKLGMKPGSGAVDKKTQ